MIVSICSGCAAKNDGIADYSRYLAEGLRGAGCVVDTVPLGFYIGKKDYYGKAAKEVNKSDICHVQFNYVYFNGELPHKNRFIYFADRIKVPIVMTVHEVRIGFEQASSGFSSCAARAAFNATLPLWNRWSYMMHKSIYNRPSRIIVHTEEHAAMVRALVKDTARVIIIPHGIPRIPEGDMAMSGVEAKKTLKLDGKKVVTIFGFINKRKGYESALTAIASLPPDIVLLIAGGKMSEGQADTLYYEGLINALSTRNLGSRVRITGHLAERDIPAVMSATDICLAPFSSSAASGALSLCVAYHKPIIASDIPVHREINQRVACLELFKNGDAGDLAEKIRTLLGDQSRPSALSAAAEAYSQKYSYERIADVDLGIYKDIVSKDAALSVEEK